MTGWLGRGIVCCNLSNWIIEVDYIPNLDFRGEIVNLTYKYKPLRKVYGVYITIELVKG
jgi:hypothetical protein